jgi:hypothetical protein
MSPRKSACQSSFLSRLANAEPKLGLWLYFIVVTPVYVIKTPKTPPKEKRGKNCD